MLVWINEVYAQLSPMFQLLTIFVGLLHVCIAYWLYVDSQRFGRRATPLIWALGGLVWGFAALGAYWWSTGCPRAALAFMVTLVTTLILTTMTGPDWAEAWDRQVWYMVRDTPARGLTQG